MRADAPLGERAPRGGEERTPDADLAVTAAAGCEWSFGQIVERYKDRVFGLMRQRCPDPATAEDLTQETFLAAWKSLGRYDPLRPFETWLFTIAVRRAASLARHKKVRRSVESAGPLTGGEPAEAPETEAGPTGEWLWELASRVLSDQANTLLWLVYAEGLSPTEVGRVLNRPPVAVRVQLHRARKRLAEAAGEELER